MTSTRNDGPARPLAFAYLSVPAHASPVSHEEMVAATTRELAVFAAREGYALAGMFADVRGRSETGLSGLLDAVRRGEAVAVVVPDLDHLRHAGCLAGADLRTTARYLRARLLTLTPGDDTSTPAANPAGPDDPHRITAAFRDALAPGSHVVISHVTDLPDQDRPERAAATREAAEVYQELAAPFVLRTPTEITELFDGLEILPPGIVAAHQWRPRGRPGPPIPVLAGIGRLPPV